MYEEGQFYSAHINQCDIHPALKHLRILKKQLELEEGGESFIGAFSFMLMKGPP